jgi:hypothetical protein
VAALAIWKVLEEIASEFRKKGVAVPQKVIDDLKSAKSLINIMEVNEASRVEANSKIAEYLGSVEAYLVSEAQKSFPPQTVDNWLKQIEKASRSSSAKEPKAEPRFTPRLSRSQRWVRVKPLPNLSIDKLETLAVESKLSFRVEEDGQLLVYGNENAVKEFIKKATAQTK